MPRNGRDFYTHAYIDPETEQVEIVDQQMRIPTGLAPWIVEAVHGLMRHVHLDQDGDPHAPGVVVPVLVQERDGR